MVSKLKLLGYLLAVNLIVLHNLTNMITNVYAQGVEESLNWSIDTSRKIFYPGEPILLTLNIMNTGNQEERVFFGSGGIEAFSMEIRNNSNKIVAKGDNIRRGGISSRGVLVTIPAGEIGRKSIVLNRWCSTLVPPGKYRVICRVEYRLRSEATRIPGTEKGFKAGHLHPIELDLDIELVKTDSSKCREILDNLAKHELRKEGQSFREWKRERDVAREMLAFTEWESAVPYQLHMLRVARTTLLKWDVINSLVRSKTLKAAIGLVQIMEEPSFYKDDMNRELIDAVYRLRETGKADIIKATNEFVLKYKRPILAKPMD